MSPLRLIAAKLYIYIKGLRMIARVLWWSESRGVVPWSETLHEA